MREIVGLARIQQIDTRIDQNQVKLDEINTRIKDKEELNILSKDIFDINNKLSTSRDHLKSSENKLQENTNKLEQSEANLYSGKIKNPKELQDIEKEIASLKKSREAYEEILLQDMMLFEEITKDLEAASSDYQNTEIKFNKLIGKLLTEKRSIQEEINILSEEKKAAEDSLSSDAINIYNKLRKSKKGLAVSNVIDGVCSCCGSTLTPANQQSVKSSNELIYCSTCGRLLFSQ